MSCALLLLLVKDYVDKAEYENGLEVVKEMLQSMLNDKVSRKQWTPQLSLFYGEFHRHRSSGVEPEKELFTYYEKISRTLGQTDLANTLAFQLFAFDHFFDWQAMLKAFREKSLPNGVRQVLLRSWIERLIQGAKPSSYHWGYYNSKVIDDWWLVWLFDSMVDAQKGAEWFQQKVSQWLTSFPTDHRIRPQHQSFLCLLTEDLNHVNQTVFHKTTACVP